MQAFLEPYESVQRVKMLRSRYLNDMLSVLSVHGLSREQPCSGERTHIHHAFEIPISSHANRPRCVRQSLGMSLGATAFTVCQENLQLYARKSFTVNTTETDVTLVKRFDTTQ